MADKVTRTKLDAQLREEVTEQITALFVADGLTPKRGQGANSCLKNRMRLVMTGGLRSM